MIIKGVLFGAPFFWSLCFFFYYFVKIFYNPLEIMLCFANIFQKLISKSDTGRAELLPSSISTRKTQIIKQKILNTIVVSSLSNCKQSEQEEHINLFIVIIVYFTIIYSIPKVLTMQPIAIIIWCFFNFNIGAYKIIRCLKIISNNMNNIFTTFCYFPSNRRSE